MRFGGRHQAVVCPDLLHASVQSDDEHALRLVLRERDARSALVPEDAHSVDVVAQPRVGAYLLPALEVGADLVESDSRNARVHLARSRILREAAVHVLLARARLGWHRRGQSLVPAEDCVALPRGFLDAVPPSSIGFEHGQAPLENLESRVVSLVVVLAVARGVV
jgi:hypothetical protein